MRPLLLTLRFERLQCAQAPPGCFLTRAAWCFPSRDTHLFLFFEIGSPVLSSQPPYGSGRLIGGLGMDPVEPGCCLPGLNKRGFGPGPVSVPVVREPGRTILDNGVIFLADCFRSIRSRFSPDGVVGAVKNNYLVRLIQQTELGTLTTFRKFMLCYQGAAGQV